MEEETETEEKKDEKKDEKKGGGRTNFIKEFRRQKSFVAWMIATIIMIGAIPIMISALMLPAIAILPAEIVMIGVIIHLTKKRGFKQVGDEVVPAQGVITRFGRSVEAVGSGLYFTFPFVEKIKEYPTGQFEMNFQILEGLYSNIGKDLIANEKFERKPMKVSVTVYYRLPKVENEYSFPMKKERFKERFPLKEVKANDLEEGLCWARIRGAELLKDHTYYRLPIKNMMKPGVVDELGAFFKGSVVGTVRSVMSVMTSKDCSEKQPEIEKEVKRLLISEEGSPFFESGTPNECLGIKIQKVKFDESMEQAFMEPEIKAREGEGRKIRAEAEAVALEGIVKTLIEQGVDPDIASIIAAGGIEGRAMTIEQLRDFFFVKGLLGGGGLEIKMPPKKQYPPKTK